MRPRKVRSAEALLRLALMYGVGKLSLRGVAAEASELELASLSDVAVLNRLRHSGDWLALILDHLLAGRAGVAAGPGVPRLALVDIGSGAIAARLVIQRIPAEQVQRQHARLRRRASRKGQKIDPRTRLAAGHVMLLTSLPAALYPAAQIAAAYRLCWQIELAFKRLKSLGGFGDLPASDPALARTWLLAQLIVAVMVETLAQQGLDSPP